MSTLLLVLVVVGELKWMDQLDILQFDLTLHLTHRIYIICFPFNTIIESYTCLLKITTFNVTALIVTNKNIVYKCKN